MKRALKIVATAWWVVFAAMLATIVKGGLFDYAWLSPIFELVFGLWIVVTIWLGASLARRALT